MDNATKTSIVKQLTKLTTDVIPDVTFRSMYGGTVIELKKDDPKSLIGGIFTYTDYVSLELSNGASLDDPGGVLEGKGKLRRHVKLHAKNDIKNKGCEALLRQALSNR